VDSAVIGVVVAVIVVGIHSCALFAKKGGGGNPFGEEPSTGEEPEDVKSPAEIQKGLHKTG
jgi:hypothetical protein